MTVTFTPAAQRDTRWRRERAARLGLGDLLLVATSCFVALAIGLAYVGRRRTAGSRDAAAVHLGRPGSDEAVVRRTHARSVSQPAPPVEHLVHRRLPSHRAALAHAGR